MFYAVISVMLILIFDQSFAEVKSHETMVNFRDPKVAKLLESSASVAKLCALESHAPPDEVRAYFTNKPPKLKSGECFVACVYEKSKFVKHGSMNPDRMIDLAAQVNGRTSRVVQRLREVTTTCLEQQRPAVDRCERAALYNNCINRHMTAFAFPVDVADWIVKQVPFVWTSAPSHPNANRLYY